MFPTGVAEGKFDREGLTLASAELLAHFYIDFFRLITVDQCVMNLKSKQ